MHFRGAARGEGEKMVDNMSHASFFFIFKLENEKDVSTQCLKITQNVSFLNFGIFHISLSKLTCLVSGNTV